ncbi:2,3-bisphosphoglycerate-independent phosphoglycerate mutase [Streptomyces profundus]|uniref:2,3-bisphosphoglycerate-independent phosphoglycerate mutase n=1 Tax=Streptomyces profundus TaxID=2867410 RepID=UPI001D15F45D|nr:2,3-bisphosphoglycerate-independent phosphoglycerate mutase [Streptomyces sp. MA3_2.13]UED87551.1 2,3-bisphosphoglycerate-independent phosphoglycerate mutase [Streptomyces sp. MA3_2.13]
MSQPGLLLVLDGWGHAPPAPDNAISLATTPTLDALTEHATLAEASGDAVGLLPGTVGNSEIGHLVIGAGRPLPYDSLLVQHAIDDGSLARDPRLTKLISDVAARDGTLHLIGLCSDGQIHAHVDHLRALLAAASAAAPLRVAIHAITDGRDVADHTAAGYLDRVLGHIGEAGIGTLATVVGRGYALDKAGRLDLTEQAVALVADLGGRAARTPEAAVAGGTGDEWTAPTHLPGAAPIADGDGLVWFNFRSDRVQQFADALHDHLAATGRTVSALSLARYDTRTPITPLVERADASGGLGDQLRAAGVRSARIAEAEKFEHVTYYLNGRDRSPRPVEEHLRITDAAPPDYVARPEMNIDRLTDAILTATARTDLPLVVANLPNMDVVGHTGDLDATVAACAHTDRAMASLLKAAEEAGRWVLAVGDHGNAERMTTTGGGARRPYGGHTTHPVPLAIRTADGGTPPPAAHATLADVAPTVLRLLDVPPGLTMTGKPLL